jgi:hypothetical protein
MRCSVLSTVISTGCSERCTVLCTRALHNGEQSRYGGRLSSHASTLLGLPDCTGMLLWYTMRYTVYLMLAQTVAVVDIEHVCALLFSIDINCKSVVAYMISDTDCYCCCMQMHWTHRTGCSCASVNLAYTPLVTSALLCMTQN